MFLASKAKMSLFAQFYFQVRGLEHDCFVLTIVELSIIFDMQGLVSLGHQNHGKTQKHSVLFG